jgi:hypothetical protein
LRVLIGSAPTTLIAGDDQNGWWQGSSALGFLQIVPEETSEGVTYRLYVNGEPQGADALSGSGYGGAWNYAGQTIVADGVPSRFYPVDPSEWREFYQGVFIGSALDCIVFLWRFTMGAARPLGGPD